MKSSSTTAIRAMGAGHKTVLRFLRDVRSESAQKLASVAVMPVSLYREVEEGSRSLSKLERERLAEHLNIDGKLLEAPVNHQNLVAATEHLM